VSKPEVAEMMKLYENCQRMMCIAYANEMADACIPHNIDPYEVCRAAATKPFGYMPYTPSLGVGGHCIPINPFYLLSNSNFPLLRACTEKMWQRPAEISERALDLLLGKENDTASLRPAMQHADSGIDLSFDEGESIKVMKGEGSFAANTRCHRSSSNSRSIYTSPSRPRVLVVGVGFKAGQSVLSNSPGQKLVQSLADSGLVDVMFADPLVKQSAIPLIPRLDDDAWSTKELESFDMIIVAVKQVGLDFSILKDLQNVDVQSWCP
jgi:UDP-N-acetyl-D-mannosaminuronate dehydrogenase